MTSNDSSSLTLSVIVPCHNEQDGLAALCARVAAACQSVVAENDFEILLINDGSTDQTLPVMRGLAAQYPCVAAVNLSRNFGHQLALSAGLAVCRGQRALLIDADLQDPPELLPAMMQEMDAGADVVYGARLSRKGDSLFKRKTAALFYGLFQKLANTAAPVESGDFRLLSRRVIDTLNAMPEQSRFLRGMIGWLGFKQVAVPYHRDERTTGVSKYPLRKMLHFALDGLTGFSVRPLRLAAYMGGAFGAGALALLIYVLHSWLSGDVVEGWTSLMVVVLVLGSVQLICLGVFGEYLGRLYLQSKGRPPFLIESITWGERELPRDKGGQIL